MSKKSLIIIAILLTVLAAALGGYYFFIKSDTTGEGSGNTFSFRNFFPFGGDSPSINPDDRPEIPEVTDQEIAFTQKLRKLSGQPVAGFGLYQQKAGITVRHMERATGHVFETELFSPRQVRISNTTIPFAYTALWSSSSTTLVAEYIEEDNQTVSAYTISIARSTTTPNTDMSDSFTLAGLPLADQTHSLVSFGSNIFYLTKNSSGSAGIVASFEDKNRKQVWNSPIKDLNAQFVNAQTVALTTKPYPGVNGYIYLVNTANGTSKKALGNVPGLSGLVSTDAKSIIALEQGDDIRMFLYTISSGVETALGPTTLPEKCVWSKKNTHIAYCSVPEENVTTQSQTAWYQGLIGFTDGIWKYDTKDNISTLVGNLSLETSEKIDMVNPQLSENEQYLVFMNKRDGSLWSLDLTK